MSSSSRCRMRVLLLLPYDDSTSMHQSSFIVLVGLREVYEPFSHDLNGAVRTTRVLEV